MIGRRETFSLLSASLASAACGTSQAPEPDLPRSVSPGWTRTSLARAPMPSAISGAGEAQCWKADYAGQSAPQTSAQVWVCRYATSDGAFNAMQRARTEAQMVRFQDRRYLVLVRWNDAPKASLTALVRAMQRAVQALAG